jgi:hypothetical protein
MVIGAAGAGCAIMRSRTALARATGKSITRSILRENLISWLSKQKRKRRSLLEMTMQCTAAAGTVLNLQQAITPLKPEQGPITVAI